MTRTASFGREDPDRVETRMKRFAGAAAEARKFEKFCVKGADWCRNRADLFVFSQNTNQTEAPWARCA